jgi:hypothetical protein
MATTKPSSPKATPPRAAKQAPAYRPTPPKDKSNRSIFMDFNQSPAEIVRVMDTAKVEAQQFTVGHKRAKRWLRWLYPAGLLFVLLDILLGYNYLTFTLVCAGVWLIAFAGLILLRRQGQPPVFGPKYDMTRTIMDTLEADVGLNRTMMGWLDLTGFAQESKEYRKKQSASGRPIVYYRDEWLRLKAKLYDSNILRVSLTEKIKDRKGYYKRSRISGKNKWKVGSSIKQHQLSISISVNPEAFQVVPFDYNRVAIPESRFAIDAALAENGRVTLKATSDKEYDAWDVLHAMKYSYKHIKPLNSNP